MKITVRISSVEIIIDRDEFREGQNNEQDIQTLRDTIIPMLSEAVKSAKELYLIGLNAQNDGKS